MGILRDYAGRTATARVACITVYYGVLIPMCRDTLASLLGVCTDTWGHCRILLAKVAYVRLF